MTGMLLEPTAPPGESTEHPNRNPEHPVLNQHRIALALATALTPVSAAAQCGLTWRPGELPGASARVEATAAWDPDGPGPAPTQLVAGGYFEAVSSVPCTLVGALDPANSRWRALGAPLVGEAVYALLPLPNGDLIVAGRFQCPSVPGTYNIARFDGTNWHALGGGIGGRVDDLALHPSGDILAVGDFVMASGVQVNGVAHWNGQAWRALGTGVPGALAVTVLNTGTVAVGGSFSSAGGVAAQNIALWNGGSWGPLGSGIGNATSSVRALDVLPNGDVVAGGSFSTAGGFAASHLARWDGSTWQAMGDPSRRVYALRALQNGDVAICLETLTGVLVWSAATGELNDIGASLDNRAYAVTQLDNGDLYVGGQFTLFANQPAYNLARYDGTVWSATAPGQPPDGQVDELLALPDGNVIARGSFTAVGGVQAPGIAQWNGSSWSPLGSAIHSAFRHPAWTVLQNGDLAVPVWNPVGGIARWNGSTWGLTAPLPNTNPFTRPILALAELANGDLVVGGRFDLPSAPGINLARWNGTAWVPFGSGTNGPVELLVRLQNGDLVAAGQFSTIDGQAAPGIARWDGSNWSAIGNEVGRWAAIAETEAGDLIVSGSGVIGSTNPFRRIIARWDGQRWHDLGQGVFPEPSSLVVLPGGDVIAAGCNLIPNGSVPCDGIARWDGQSWQPVGAGAHGSIASIVRRRNGDLVIGGSFTAAGGYGAVNFTSITPDCPASVQTHGAWCASSTGPLEFQHESMAWAGGTYRATCSGIPSNGLAFALHGLRLQTTPLSRWYTSRPGCVVSVQSLATQWLPANNGRATLAFAVPNNPGLVGVTLTQQVIHAEPIAGPQVFVLSSSNALRATIGSY